MTLIKQMNTDYLLIFNLFICVHLFDLRNQCAIV